MKVLVLTTLFPRAKDDSLGVFVYHRTAELAKLCDVRVVSLQAGSGLPARERLGDVEVLRPRWWRVPKALPLSGFFYTAFARRALRRLRAEFDFDVIDAHFVYPDGYAGVRLGRAFGRPTVVWARGADVNKLCFWWPTRRLARAALRGADRLAAVSASLRDGMVAAGADPAKIRVIPNGVDTSVFRPGPQEAARRALGLPPEGKVVFSAGALIPRKGHEHVIAGFGRLDPRHQAHLYIAGRGPDEPLLRRLIDVQGLGGRVTLVGHVDPSAIADWYRAADVFCLGSLSEGCPNVLREALATGTPVVSTNVDGAPEVVEGDCCGLLVPPRDPDAVARALDAALSRAWDRAHIAERGKARSWASAASDSLALLEEVVAEHRGMR